MELYACALASFALLSAALPPAQSPVTVVSCSAREAAPKCLMPFAPPRTPLLHVPLFLLDLCDLGCLNVSVSLGHAHARGPADPLACAQPKSTYLLGKTSQLASLATNCPRFSSRFGARFSGCSIFSLSHSQSGTVMGPQITSSLHPDPLSSVSILGVPTSPTIKICLSWPCLF